MLKKFFVLGWGLLIVALIGVSIPSMTYAQQGSGEKPNFVFVNYIGQDLVLDLDDVTYTVPGTATAPQGGRLELSLAAGEHKYAANVPGITQGSSGTFIISPGGYVGKGARLDKTSETLDRNGNVLEKPKDYVLVFEIDPFAAPTTATPVATATLWQPAPAAPEKGSLAWTNYTGDELTVDLNGQLYKVPPAVNNLPGHLQIDLPPALYRYTASVPNGSLNGEINVGVGQVTGLTISAKIQPKPTYEVGEPKPELEPVELVLNQEDLTARAVVADQPTPAVSLTPVITATTPITTPEATPAAAPGLVIKNYTGDTLVFTINNQAYSAPPNVETTLTLPAGQYDYTASLPYAATTGTVAVTPDKRIELSIAINLNRDLLSVYQN